MKQVIVVLTVFISLNANAGWFSNWFGNDHNVGSNPTSTDATTGHLASTETLTIEGVRCNRNMTSGLLDFLELDEQLRCSTNGKDGVFDKAYCDCILEQFGKGKTDNSDEDTIMHFIPAQAQMIQDNNEHAGELLNDLSVLSSVPSLYGQENGCRDRLYLNDENGDDELERIKKNCDANMNTSFEQFNSSADKDNVPIMMTNNMLYSMLRLSEGSLKDQTGGVQAADSSYIAGIVSIAAQKFKETRVESNINFSTFLNQNIDQILIESSTDSSQQTLLKVSTFRGIDNSSLKNILDKVFDQRVIQVAIASHVDAGMESEAPKYSDFIDSMLSGPKAIQEIQDEINAYADKRCNDFFNSLNNLMLIDSAAGDITHENKVRIGQWIDRVEYEFYGVEVDSRSYSENDHTLTLTSQALYDVTNGDFESYLDTSRREALTSEDVQLLEYYNRFVNPENIKENPNLQDSLSLFFDSLEFNIKNSIDGENIQLTLGYNMCSSLANISELKKNIIDANETIRTNSSPLELSNLYKQALDIKRDYWIIENERSNTQALASRIDNNIGSNYSLIEQELASLKERNLIPSHVTIEQLLNDEFNYDQTSDAFSDPGGLNELLQTQRNLMSLFAEKTTRLNELETEMKEFLTRADVNELVKKFKDANSGLANLDLPDLLDLIAGNYSNTLAELQAYQRDNNLSSDSALGRAISEMQLSHSNYIVQINHSCGFENNGSTYLCYTPEQTIQNGKDRDYSDRSSSEVLSALTSGDTDQMIQAGLPPHVAANVNQGNGNRERIRNGDVPSTSEIISNLSESSAGEQRRVASIDGESNLSSSNSVDDSTAVGALTKAFNDEGSGTTEGADINQQVQNNFAANNSNNRLDENNSSNDNSNNNNNSSNNDSSNSMFESIRQMMESNSQSIANLREMINNEKNRPAVVPVQNKETGLVRDNSSDNTSDETMNIDSLMRSPASNQPVISENRRVDDDFEIDDDFGTSSLPFSSNGNIRGNENIVEQNPGSGVASGSGSSNQVQAIDQLVRSVEGDSGSSQRGGSTQSSSGNTVSGELVQKSDGQTISLSLLSDQFEFQYIQSRAEVASIGAVEASVNFDISDVNRLKTYLEELRQSNEEAESFVLTFPNGDIMVFKDKEKLKEAEPKREVASVAEPVEEKVEETSEESVASKAWQSVTNLLDSWFSSDQTDNTNQ